MSSARVKPFSTGGKNASGNITACWISGPEWPPPDVNIGTTGVASVVVHVSVELVTLVVVCVVLVVVVCVSVFVVSVELVTVPVSEIVVVLEVVVGGNDDVSVLLVEVSVTVETVLVELIVDVDVCVVLVVVVVGNKHIESPIPLSSPSCSGRVYVRKLATSQFKANLSSSAHDHVECRSRASLVKLADAASNPSTYRFMSPGISRTTARLCQLLSNTFNTGWAANFCLLPHNSLYSTFPLLVTTSSAQGIPQLAMMCSC